MEFLLVELILKLKRYYGQSLPFGILSYTSPEYLGYLSTGQALADYVYLINDLQKTYAGSDDSEKLPVVVFGGSYGGMLASWLRMKYPGTVLGAIASSAPILYFKGLTSCGSFLKIITDDFEKLGGTNCSENIKKSWDIIRSETKTDTGKSELSKLWKLCPVLDTDDDIDNLINWLTNIYAFLAEVNYPYPQSFLVPLPGYPVKEFCSKMNYEYDDNIGLLTAMAEALQVYTNYTGSTICNNIVQSTGELGEDGWNFQSCTEMVMPMCSTESDMFENYEWDFDSYADNCYEQFGVRPWSEEVPLLEYGGKHLSDFSNIVFSNGVLDPWSSGGVMENVSSTVLAIVIPDGVHHSDLRASNEKDPESVQFARMFHVNQITKWLDIYYSTHLRITVY